MNSKSSVWRLAGASVVIAALGLLLAGCGVNNIPSYEESAKADWSQVLNQHCWASIGLRQPAAF